MSTPEEPDANIQTPSIIQNEEGNQEESEKEANVSLSSALLCVFMVSTQDFRMCSTILMAIVRMLDIYVLIAAIPISKWKKESKPTGKQDTTGFAPSVANLDQRFTGATSQE